MRRHAVAAALRDASDGVLSVWNGLLSMTPEHDAVEKAHSSLPSLVDCQWLELRVEANVGTGAQSKIHAEIKSNGNSGL